MTPEGAHQRGKQRPRERAFSRRELEATPASFGEAFVGIARQCAELHPRVGHRSVGSCNLRPPDVHDVVVCAPGGRMKDTNVSGESARDDRLDRLPKIR